jgi:hypothetical protein
VSPCKCVFAYARRALNQWALLIRCRLTGCVPAAADSYLGPRARPSLGDDHHGGGTRRHCSVRAGLCVRNCVCLLACRLLVCIYSRAILLIFYSSERVCPMLVMECHWRRVVRARPLAC